MYDLLLKGGWIIDPAQGWNANGDIAFVNGLVAKVAMEIPAVDARTVHDVSGKIVTPGLIDLHAHVYWGGTSLGVDADEVGRRSGTTTFIDVGSAGAGNYHGFLRHVIEPAQVRILSFLNISFPGIYGFSRALMVGEAIDLRLLDVAEATRVALENRETIVGIKARAGAIAGTGTGLAPLELALEAADAADLPVMAHIDLPPPSRRDVLRLLRQGDTLTHVYRPFPNSPLDGRGRIIPEMIEARDRGVLFDVGHGMGSFSFAIASAMLEQGFAPDTISSDVHALSIDGPAFDLLVTMSKFLCLGMPVEEIVRAVTIAPARAIKRPELGTLQVGCLGDATILDIEDGTFQYVDSTAEILNGSQRFHLSGMVIAGETVGPILS
jgi:dihydroorotase